jgi:predicted Zn-dependent protease
MWLATDERYKNAAERLVKVQAERAINAADDDTSDDFSADPPGTFVGASATLDLDRRTWEERVKALSAAFRQRPEIIEANVELSASAETHYLTSSEGASLQRGGTHARLVFTAQSKADDGMDLQLQDTVDASSFARLPDQSTLLARVQSLVDRVVALRSAPVAEPYVGPAILDGRAAAVFFHETFGHRVEGHRQKDDQEGQTFAKKIGERVMPDFIDVWDDPTVRTLNGTELNGYYPFDDEGIAAQKASLVDKGILKGFLMSRAPTRGFSHSNGHGRRASGQDVVARQANLVVDPARVHTKEDLKKMLLAEVKKQGKPYGLRFADVEGGYTTTARADIQAFKVRPVVVYQVFPDGHEELVRGVDLEGTPLTSLSTILAAGNDFAVFNGFCGAESGWVPVSAASPSLLVGQMEVAHKQKASDKPPILPPPSFFPHASTDEPLVAALHDELTRSTEQLRLPDAARPYYLALLLSDRTDVGVVASFGALVRKGMTRGRYLSAEVRVGDYALDNSNLAARPSKTTTTRFATTRGTSWTRPTSKRRRTMRGRSRRARRRTRHRTTWVTSRARSRRASSRAAQSPRSISSARRRRRGSSPLPRRNSRKLSRVRSP